MTTKKQQFELNLLAHRFALSAATKWLTLTHFWQPFFENTQQQKGERPPFFFPPLGCLLPKTSCPRGIFLFSSSVGKLQTANRLAICG